MITLALAGADAVAARFAARGARLPAALAEAMAALAPPDAAAAVNEDTAGVIALGLARGARPAFPRNARGALAAARHRFTPKPRVRGAGSVAPDAASQLEAAVMDTLTA